MERVEGTPGKCSFSQLGCSENSLMYGPRGCSFLGLGSLGNFCFWAARAVAVDVGGPGAAGLGRGDRSDGTSVARVEFSGGSFTSHIVSRVKVSAEVRGLVRCGCREEA